MAQLDHATQQNAALVEQMAAAAHTLNLQAQGLVESVALFRVGDASAAQHASPSRPVSSAQGNGTSRPVSSAQGNGTSRSPGLGRGARLAAPLGAQPALN